jgi:cytochrome c biogenesis protein CcmG/thiol:disulfide interchange protein DsbE
MSNRRWTLAGAGVIALGLSAIPFIPDPARDATPAAAASEAAGTAVCRIKNRRAPDFTLKDMNGLDVRLAHYQGKVVFVNFWATTCGPCKYEIPLFVELQKRYGSQGLAFLGISVDDPPETLRPFAAEHKMNYPVLVGLGREDVQDAYGPLFGIPVTVVVARDGAICSRYFGLQSRERFENDIKALL